MGSFQNQKIRLWPSNSFDVCSSLQMIRGVAAWQLESMGGVIATYYWLETCRTKSGFRASRGIALPHVPAWTVKRNCIADEAVYRQSGKAGRTIHLQRKSSRVAPFEQKNEIRSLYRPSLTCFQPYLRPSQWYVITAHCNLKTALRKTGMRSIALLSVGESEFKNGPISRLFMATLSEVELSGVHSRQHKSTFAPIR